MTQKLKPKKYKRKPVERIRDRTRIASLYLSGNNEQEIAKMLGVSQSTISRDIKTLQAEWIERSSQDINTLKAEEIAYLKAKRVELEAIWQLSQNRINTIKTKRATMVGGVITQQELSEREELELADTKIGQLLISISEKLTALTGIEAPKKLASTTPDGSESAPASTIIVYEK